jgi:hypothetical protein
MHVAFIATGGTASGDCVDPGLMAVSAAAKAAGHTCSLTLIKSPEGVAAAVAELTAKKPDCLACGVYSSYWWECRTVITALRARLDVPLVCGGYHATFAPEETLATEGVDYLCTGEGELAFPALLSRLERGEDASDLPGIWHKDAAGVLHAPKTGTFVADLDSVPRWDRELFATPYLPQPLDFCPSAKLIPLSTGRGCSKSCGFCPNGTLRRLSGAGARYVRKRRIEAVLSEAEALVQRYPADYFLMVDEQFASDQAWIRAFCEGWRARIAKPFIAATTVDSLPHEVMAPLAECGLSAVLLGVEVGDEDYRRRVLGKAIAQADIEGAFKACRAHGIRTVAGIMMRLPDETKENMAATCALLERCQPDAVMPCTYEPRPGTPMSRDCERRGLIETVTSAQVDAEFAHQLSGHESNLLRTGADAFVRVRPNKISLEDYRAFSDRIDQMVVERWPASLVEQARRSRRERREGALEREQTAPTPETKAGSLLFFSQNPVVPESDEICTAFAAAGAPIALLPTVADHAPAAHALSGSPLAVVVRVEGDEARSLMPAAIATGRPVLGSLAACKVAAGNCASVAADVPFFYAGAMPLFCALATERLPAGERRQIDILCRPPDADGVLLSCLLAAKLAGSEPELTGLTRPVKGGVLATFSLPGGGRCTLRTVDKKAGSASWWRASVDAGEERTCWSLGEGHEILWRESHGRSARIEHAGGSGPVVLAQAFLAFASRGVTPLVSARDIGIASRMQQSIDVMGKSAASGPAPLLDPLLGAPQATPDELLDLVSDERRSREAASSSRRRPGRLAAVLDDWGLDGTTLKDRLAAAAFERQDWHRVALLVSRSARSAKPR